MCIFAAKVLCQNSKCHFGTPFSERESNAYLSHRKVAARRKQSNIPTSHRRKEGGHLSLHIWGPEKLFINKIYALNLSNSNETRSSDKKEIKFISGIHRLTYPSGLRASLLFYITGYRYEMYVKVIDCFLEQQNR